MRRLDLIQGSHEWHAHRATARNASEAPAVLGCSPFTPRTELLHQRHTGIRPEATPDQERRYADGHAIEAAQLRGAAAVIGEPLYPVTGTEVVDGIELSASFDGLTMAEDVAYECKTLNDDLRSALPVPGPDGNHWRCLPKHYRVQMEQQLMVCGGERVLFVAANKDGSDVRRCWYEPQADLRAEILAGWRQFDADLAAYVPPTASAAEKVVAEPVEALPAPVVKVEGQIALKDNFGVFEERLRHFLEHRLIREPKSDQDFADLDQQIKAMKAARESLKAAGAQMLAQVEPVEAATKRQKMLDTLLQQNVSMAERLLTAEKDRRKAEIVEGGKKALQAHIDALHARLGKPYLPLIPADFAGVVRGLKSLASMEDKVATELARAKIAANEVADRIDVNLKALRELAADYKTLFHDAAVLVLKAPDDCRAVIVARIAEHKAAEQKRAEELAEKERERIRAEEQARAEAEARRKLAEEQAAAAAAELAAAKAKPEGADLSPGAQALHEQEGAARFAQHHPTAAPAPVQVFRSTGAARPVVAAAPPTLRLGTINERISPLSIDSAGLAELGFPVIATEKGAKLYREDDYPRMVAAMQAVLQAAVEGVAA